MYTRHEVTFEVTRTYKFAVFAKSDKEAEKIANERISDREYLDINELGEEFKIISIIDETGE